jgi:nucleoside-diphosphate-sugar epimerase
LKKIELVSADLTDKDAIYKAVEGCDYVMHVASPFPVNSPKNEDELVKPAVEGTIAVLEACDTYDVKRVIVTSSCACIEDFTLGNAEVDEDHKTDISKFQTYYVRSKIYAERAAFETIEKINENRKKNKKEILEMVVVNPSFIVGPPLIKGDSSSLKFFAMMLEGKYPGIPPYYLKAIDVRDVALAHIKALDVEPFKRYALVSMHYKCIDSCKWIDEEFSKYGYKPNRKELGTCVLWLASFFNQDAKNYYFCRNKKCDINTDRTKQALGMKYRDIKESCIEMCYKLIELGFVEDKTKG